MQFKIGEKVKIKIGDLKIFGIVKGVNKEGRYTINCHGTEIGCFEEDLESY